MPDTNKTRIEPPNEDTIQCFFFSTAIDLGLRLLEELCMQLNNAVQNISKEYIWQRDEFHIFLPIDNYETGMPLHLYSSTCFGDNIEDEWFIVHILFELTRVHKDLVIQVKDNDGDFLLIEAADYLPSWANPETTENRVYIHNNHLHIISPQIFDLQSKLEVKEALDFIIKSPELTQASNDIQKPIIDRIKNYPEKARLNIHKAFAKLPRHLATLLTLKPSLIAPIVDTYCHHDVIDAKCCKNLNYDDCITIEVKFTKFLYAMLTHSKLLSYVKHRTCAGTEKKSILGLKLLCGFQMIMSKSNETDIFSSKEYNSFISNLKRNGYFNNNIADSKKYNQLLEKAKDYFANIESPMSSHISYKVLQLMSSEVYKELKDSIVEDRVLALDVEENNEDWLHIHPDQLNELLQTRYGKKTNFKNDDISSPETITTELSNFLKQTSDLEGIEPNNSENVDHNTVDFESDQFVACLEKMLNILSTGNNNENNDSNLNSDNDDDFTKCTVEDNCDLELKAKLQTDQDVALEEENIIFGNIVRSMKEEKASTGPSSNLLRTAGFRKCDVLDSDDDFL